MFDGILKVYKKMWTTNGVYSKAITREFAPSEVDRKLNRKWMKEDSSNDKVHTVVEDSEIIRKLDVADKGY